MTNRGYTLHELWLSAGIHLLLSIHLNQAKQENLQTSIIGLQHGSYELVNLSTATIRGTGTTAEVSFPHDGILPVIVVIPAAISGLQGVVVE